MSGLVEAFDYIVVGDEPSAYWWIDKIISYTKALPKDGNKTFSVPKILHLSLRGEGETEVPLPLSIAERFGIRHGAAEEVECIFPERLLRWNKETLKERFGFESLKRSPTAFVPLPKSSDLATIRFHLQQHPELLDLATGLWRIFGRAERLEPDFLLWNALQITKFSFWKPSLPVKEPTLRQSTLKDLPDSNWVRLNSHGNFEVEHLSGNSYAAPELLLAVNGNELMGLKAKCPDLTGFLPSTKDFLSETALYTLELSGLGDTLFTHLQPFSTYFEHSSLPMPEEIFHIRSKPDTKNLSIHFLSKFDFSLDTISDTATHAYNQLLKLLPDLSHLPHTIEPPLDVKDLLTDERREAASKTFQVKRKPRYKASLLHSRTEHPRIQLFTPFLNCHLAYPFSQLEAARTSLHTTLGAKRFRKSSHLVEAPAFFG